MCCLERCSLCRFCSSSSAVLISKFYPTVILLWLRFCLSLVYGASLYGDIQPSSTLTSWTFTRSSRYGDLYRRTFSVSSTRRVFCEAYLPALFFTSLYTFSSSHTGNSPLGSLVLVNHP